ncbi:hypothetical protein FPF71_10595 [Algibacter amylolyticus]|uniref:DUF2069 domain-containing protein n=1 Tax=Algibacter amylolyticus TaxID=1608400 RepID=A0A5M7B6W8_9FLAO|nr:hypothetical protein [Algibacter amylolyticus]KAA5824058.1 hypothetical protein F2B50_10595 [Algibacter amylolyticus]MBB5269612.1 multisubunit Na+/H+ antiporter MnhE subunit [Algibacter amylolyticus]TSJ74535.1 hypothetical protein FPF71_10595 [Algibacter amylolyticus]
MKSISNYTKLVPYLYFIAITAYWFTVVNRTEGLTAYPILLFGIPFLWQILKPSKKLNFTLGITFVCISSYLILAFVSDMLQIVSVSYPIKQFMVYGGLFIFASFAMALWIIKNSLTKSV